VGRTLDLGGCNSLKSFLQIFWWAAIYGLMVVIHKICNPSKNSVRRKAWQSLDLKTRLPFGAENPILIS
jgi:hypothetical protein